MRPWYKKKRYILLYLSAIVVGILIGQVGGGTDTADTGAVPAVPTATATEAPQTQAAPAPEPQAPEIGDAVNAGDWTFKVTELECGVEKVGSEYLNQEAQGQFCLLSLDVTNNGDEAETLSDSNQRLLDDKGRQFSADSGASLYAAGNGESFFLKEINPGNTLKGLIVFDIPEGVKPVEASLAGGFLGGSEAKVRLP